jgi:predicted Zn-dependent protease
MTQHGLVRHYQRAKEEQYRNKWLMSTTIIAKPVICVKLAKMNAFKLASTAPQV